LSGGAPVHGDLQMVRVDHDRLDELLDEGSALLLLGRGWVKKRGAVGRRSLGDRCHKVAATETPNR
jgi:hypothetical protein